MGRPEHIFFLALLCSLPPMFDRYNNGLAKADSYEPVRIGVILDLQTMAGKRSQTTISMSIEDFYAAHSNFTPRVSLTFRDSKQDALGAASAGPQNSEEARIVSLLCNKSQVPLISFAAPLPFVSPASIPYFIRATLDDSSTAFPIASFIQLNEWRTVVLVFEDSEYGASVFLSFVNSLQKVDVTISDNVKIPTSATDGFIDKELYNLMRKQTRVFIVHMMPDLASRFFQRIAQVDMMEAGYVWIATNSITGMLKMLDPDDIQGLIGFRPHAPSSITKSHFISRFRTKFQQDHPGSEPSNPTPYEFWAYDAAWSIASVAEELVLSRSPVQMAQSGEHNLTCFDKLEVLQTGPEYLNMIHSTSFNGLSGKFRLVEGQLQFSTFEIVNVIGNGVRVVGLWTREAGFAGTLEATNITLKKGLKTIIWPGDATIRPKGFTIPISGNTLRIAAPKRQGLQHLVNFMKEKEVSGYCIDVFDAVMRRLPYAASYVYIPVVSKTYDELITMVYRKEFDALVGDVTIEVNRSSYINFAFSYTEPGISMLVPVKKYNRKTWIFLQPLTTGLWFASFCFIMFTGIVIWVIEHRVNPNFRGTLKEQLGITIFFAFSTIFFSHKEKLESNLSRSSLVMWLSVVLILTSSYIASFTSILTVQQLVPAVTNVAELKKRGEYVGFQSLLVWDLLIKDGFDQRKLINYTTPDHYEKALTKGSARGGVSAIFDEIPYLKLFLSDHCVDDYTIVGPIYDSNGFGFAFPKGSSLAPDVSTAILDLKDSGEMEAIRNKWFSNSPDFCKPQNDDSDHLRLPFESFAGLFIITGLVSSLMLVIHLGLFIFNEWDMLKSIAESESTNWKKISAWLKYYSQKDPASRAFRGENEMLQSSGGVREGNQNVTSMNNVSMNGLVIRNNSEDMHSDSLQRILNAEINVLSPEANNEEM
ncbi:hypothetical protein LUZ60_001327 [Juncus effusus]|nr:hypothetical protein LUZ60_001327 [Juncus effusus]